VIVLTSEDSELGTSNERERVAFVFPVGEGSPLSTSSSTTVAPFAEDAVFPLVDFQPLTLIFLQNDLQAAVQQWLVVNGKSRHPVVAQSHEDVFCICWNPVEVDSNTSDEMDALTREQSKPIPNGRPV
ncbi:hypothetical protein STEG23_036858, partial [Scotinomys teguina]